MATHMKQRGTNYFMSEKTNSSPDINGEDFYIIALASLFDGDFSIDWIVELISDKASRVLVVLEKLVKKRLLKRRKTGIYSFSNIYDRDLIRENLPPEKKAEYHQRIANLMLAESLDDNIKPETLSYHLLHISNDMIGCNWLKKAGDFFLKHYHSEQALKCYLKVLNDLSAYNGDDADLLFIETAIKYSKSSQASQETRKVLTVLKAALKRTKSSPQHAPYRLFLNIHLAMNEWLRSHYTDAMKYFEEGRRIAESLGDKQLLLKTNKFNLFFLFWQGHFKEVIKSYERFVPEVTTYPKDSFPLLGVVIAGLCYSQMGQLSQGLGLLDALRKHAIEIGDQHSECYAIGSIGMVMLNILKIDESLQYLENTAELAIKARNGWMSILTKLCLAYIYYLKGENEKTIIYLQEFNQLSSHVQVSMWPYPYLMELCWAMEQGKLNAVKGFSLKKEIDNAFNTENVFLKGLAYRYQALCEAREGASSDRIFEILNLSVKCLEACGSKIETAKSQFEIVRAYQSVGKEEAAVTTSILAVKNVAPLSDALIPSDIRSLVRRVEFSEDRSLLKEILKLGQEIINIRDSKELVLQIISTVNRITGAERGAIFIKDELNLKLKASENLTSMQISHPDFAPFMDVIKAVATTGKGCIKIMIPARSIKAPFDEVFPTVICVPMILRGQLTGVLYHENQLLSNPFKESDLQLLAYFAAQAAFALDNVTTYEELQKKNQRLSEEKIYLEEQFQSRFPKGDIISRSSAMKNVINQVMQVAKIDTTVLILGETGVGKELVARSLHQHSSRKEKPFVCIQCSALSETLLPSELFGHEIGSFTGAIKRRIGRFEMADMGTLFMDEIGELSQDIQTLLLRVLQTKQFERVGGSKTISSNFRLIAATNRNLEEAVQNHRFRMDLFYRINVFPIRIPPLRERKEDIPLLANHFLEMYSKKLCKRIDSIHEKDLDRLIRYDWPGNVRELENIIERCVILSSGPLLATSGLIPDNSHANNTQSSYVEGEVTTLSENERQHILSALHKTGWKVSGPGGAAKLLNINPSTLSFRMKKLGIRNPRKRLVV